MRAELKALAKKSFVEEFEMWHSTTSIIKKSTNNNALDMMENHSMHAMEQQIQYLQQVVEELQQTQSTQSPGPSSPLQWSNALVREQRSASLSRPYVPESPSSPPHDHPNNSLFVLSAAPIAGFDTLVQQQIASREANDPTGSLLEQAQRFAQITTLFQPPAQPAAEDDWLKRQLEEYDAQSKAERSRQREAQRVHKQRLDSTVEQHRERLVKARHPVRRFPLEAKPSSSTTSPRIAAHRYREQHRPHAQQVGERGPVSQTGASLSFPEHQGQGSGQEASAAVSMAGPSSFASPASSAAAASPCTSPPKPMPAQVLTVDEFEQKTSR
jgi:hypothetical protein